MRKTFAIVMTVLALSAPAWAQPQVDAVQLYLGTTGSTCVLHSGSGAPSGGLGAVCDVYVRNDSPYTTYRKTGASTWSELYRAGGTDVAVGDGGTGLSSWATGDLVYASGSTTLAGLAAVGAGSVLTSGTTPAWSATPSITSLTASGGLQGATVTGTTSITTPILTASGTLTLSPTGDLITNPGGSDILPGTGYATNIGALSSKYLALHVGELWAETLVAQNTIATIGGRILVGPTTTLTADVTTGATSISVKHNQMVSGDRVVLQVNGAVEWMAVTSGPSGSGPYSYSVTRDLDGSGANAWTAGDAMFNTGQTGNGYIDQYSVAGLLPGSTAGPSIVGNVRTGATYSQVAPRWAIGNLAGTFNYPSTTYGAAFGDASATNVTIDATNGFRIRSGTLDKLVADTSGNLSLSGDLSVGTVGTIRSGSTTYGSGTGYVLDYSGSAYRFRVGTTSGNRIAWDGTDLTLKSAAFTVDSTGVTIAPSTTFTSDTGYKWTVSTGDLGLFARESGATPGRVIGMEAEWTGVGDKQTAASLSASHSKSGGTLGYAGVGADAIDNGGWVTVSAKQYARFTGPYNTLQIFTNNGNPSGANPYMRGEGNHLVIESRSNANGGGIYLSNDVAADIIMGVAGGTQLLYTPSFPSTAPNWATSLAQTTVGAAGAGSALPATPAGYVKIKVNGANYVVPVYNP